METKAAKTARGSAGYRRFTLAMLLAGLATFAVFYCVQPLLPLFSNRFGVNAADASLVVSITLGPMAVALLAAGALSDRFGRRPLMIVSLLAAGGLTLAAAAAPDWNALLALRLLAGLALAGVPAVAMAYIVEEVEDADASHAMGLYISGTAMGGMSGRLLGGFVAEYADWRAAVGLIGGLVVLIALLFWRYTPHSAHFTPRAQSLAGYWAGLRRLFADKAIPWLFTAAFLLMGAFVCIYNYASFRLVAPPYNLSQAMVGAIFLLFIVGSISSTWAGGLAGRLGAGRVFWVFLLIFLIGIGLTAATPLPVVILGIGVVTVGFFGAHSIASGWVGRRAGADRSQAAALYLFFYYLGGSVLGMTGGIAWTHAAWPGVALFTAGLVGAGLVISLLLARPAPAAVEGASSRGNLG